MEKLESSTKKLESHGVESWGDLRGTSRFRVFRGGNGNKINGGKTRNRSFSIKDYNWSNELDYNRGINEDDYLPIQKAIVSEFQPDFVHSWGDIINLLPGTITGIGGKLGDFLGVGESVHKATISVTRKAGISIIQGLQKSYENDPSLVLGTPINFVKNMFQGRFINIFEIPFFSPEYLSADTTGNWSQGGAKEIIGDETAKILKESLSVDFPTTPMWSLSDNASRKTIGIQFYLINNSEKNLDNNFSFLHNILPGAFWMQMGYVQKSPNIYDIEVPGRFHIYFAGLGIEAKCIGKLRTCDFMYKKYGNTIKSITNSTLYPDAYEININIVDLTPNNFNAYIKYLKDGNDNINVGDFREHVGLTNVTSDLTKAISEKATKIFSTTFGGNK